MSFQLNNAQQMAISDSLLSLTERERKYLNNSWAETFTKKIFPFIDEDRFSVLYSDNPASRPNNPINPQSQAKFPSKSQTFFHS
jgi:hypothetical protein